MKKIVLLLLVISLLPACGAVVDAGADKAAVVEDDAEKAALVEDNADKAEVETVVLDVYKSITFQPGEKPDWDAFRAIMAPGAILAPVRQGKISTVDEFIDGFNQAISGEGNMFARRGFVEKQLHAVTEIYAGVAHVFTTYETTFADGSPLGRGINSMQLARIDGKWLITSIAWDDENNSELEIPAKYLGEK